jgi:single-stranded-DNA-specific exonuclease
MSAAATRWTVRAQDNTAARALHSALGVPLPLAAVLVCRGLENVDAARAFLSPSIDQLHDPLLMLSMETAVARIRAAIHASEPMLVYGDYDVDGTVATVLLKTAIERAAAAMGTTADVRYHIPHRIREGYGMTDARVEAAAEEGVRLVISVDTGIRAFAAAATAERVGLDLIVTDHHLPDVQGVPHAVAVLNPNQPGCTYPYKELCGAGVAFKLAQAILETSVQTSDARRALAEKTVPSFLKLLAIATIADSVPLTGENRVIAAIGLHELQRPAQGGLRALMELAQMDTASEISAMDVGFRLAPRINAAGRMDIASDVVDMFLERDPAAARTIAEKLHRLNEERRSVEAEALRAIEERIEALRALPGGLASALVLDDPAWHRGVIGILASRVVDRTGLPALVIAHEDGQAYGSGRSVAGFHLLDALTAIATNYDDPTAPPLFTRFGGHAHAVGFSLPSASVEKLRTRMAAEAARMLAGRAAEDELECDAALDLAALDQDFLAWFQKLGPFGQGNREPVFVSRGLTLATAVKVIKEKHLRLALHDPATGARMGAMAWSRKTNWALLAEAWQLTAGTKLDLAYRLVHNKHPNFGGWEMDIVAMRKAEPAITP